MWNARALLMVLMSFLATGESCWYTMNGRADHCHSLARRLGFYQNEEYYAFLIAAGLAKCVENKRTGIKKMHMLSDQWENMIKAENAENAEQFFQFDTKRFDLDAVINGETQINKCRFDHLAIRIGVKKAGESYAASVSDQIREDVAPPNISGLLSMQRSLCRNVRRMTYDVIVEDQDLFETLAIEYEINKNRRARERAEAKASSLGKRQRPPSTTATENGVRNKEGVFGTEEATALLQSLSLEERDILLTEVVVGNTSKKDSLLQFRNVRNRTVESYVRVPANKTDQSFERSAAWLDTAIKANAGEGVSKFKSAKRTMKYLGKKFKDASREALKEMKLMSPGQMNEIQMGAMWTAGDVSSKNARRNILKHLRHHFGKHSFAPEYKVQMLCEGHTKVTTGFIDLPKTKEGARVRIHYSQKNIADELAAQLERQLANKKITDPSRIKRIDTMAGGDHGQGAFIFGAKVVVVLSGKTEEDEDESFSFEISVAEVLCTKDTAEILSKTVRDELTKGLKQIQLEKLLFGAVMHEGGSKVSCSFSATPGVASIPINVELYIVGDLAFTAVVLGKDGMSHSWCPMCKMRAAEMPNLNATGEIWQYAEMKKLGEEHQKKMRLFEQNDKVSPPKAQLGCKDTPWWPFIPVERFIVPLLHCLIGIGDAILTKFREEVSEKIEYLSPEEVKTRSHLAELEVKQAEVRQEVKDFDVSEKGKELSSHLGKVGRAKKSLKKLDTCTNGPGANTISVKNDAPVSVLLFLQEVTDFIEYGGDDDDEEYGLEGTADDVNMDGNTVDAADAVDAAPDKANRIRNKVAEVKARIVQLEEKIVPLKASRKKITDRRDKSGKYIARAKEHIKTFKSDRKIDDEGIETALFSVFKDLYGVKLQAYHGGSLHGKDHQKIMSNADEIFTLFAEILKENAKKDCKLTHDEIEELCQKYSNLYILWDGAFSYASTINPSREDIAMYERFVTAAVHSHKELGMNVTPKVHLMWMHVKRQMEFPGGLGDKREDWVEHQHQITRKLRNQFRTTKDMEVRGDAMARLHHQQTNPEVQAYMERVDASTRRGPRKDYTTADAARRAERKSARASALELWEIGHRKEMLALRQRGTHNGDASLASGDLPIREGFFC